jgi:hypothetical protein
LAANLKAFLVVGGEKALRLAARVTFRHKQGKEKLAKGIFYA